MWSYIFSIWVLLSLFFSVTIDYFCNFGIITIYHLTIYVKISSWVLYLNQLVSMSLCQHYTILIFTAFHLFLLFLFSLRIVLAIHDLLRSYIWILGISPTAKKYTYNSSFASNCIGIRGSLGEHRHLNNTMFSNILT